MSRCTAGCTTVPRTSPEGTEATSSVESGKAGRRETRGERRPADLRPPGAGASYLVTADLSFASRACWYLMLRPVVGLPASERSCQVSVRSPPTRLRLRLHSLFSSFRGDKRTRPRSQMKANWTGPAVFYKVHPMGRTPSDIIDVIH